MTRKMLLTAAVAVALLAETSSAVLPAGAAARPWMNTAASPVDRANALLARMTLAEKIAMMHQGASCDYGACVDGNTRLGIPQLRLQDGPAGVADGAAGVTQLPAPVAVAASWDTALTGQYGQVIGSEEWGKGANTVLGPTINIDRDPRWGRSFESLSEDPYLAARLGVSTGWILRRRLQRHGVRILSGVSYDRIDDSGLHYRQDGQAHTLAADTIVVCTGQEPVNGLAAELEGPQTNGFNSSYASEAGLQAIGRRCSIFFRGCYFRRKPVRQL